MLCPMANGMYGREELSPVICLFLCDGDALCRVPVIPEIYPKPSHHSRLRMDLRRAVGVDGFPSLRYILINDFLMRLRHHRTIHVFFAFPGLRVAEPGGGWVGLAEPGVLQVSCFLEGCDCSVHVPHFGRGEGWSWVLVPSRKNAQPLCEEYVPCWGGVSEFDRVAQVLGCHNRGPHDQP